MEYEERLKESIRDKNPGAALVAAIRELSHEAIAVLPLHESLELAAGGICEFMAIWGAIHRQMLKQTMADGFVPGGEEALEEEVLLAAEGLNTWAKRKVGSSLINKLNGDDMPDPETMHGLMELGMRKYLKEMIGGKELPF